MALPISELYSEVTANHKTYPQNSDLLYFQPKFSLGNPEKCSLVAAIMTADTVMDGESKWKVTVLLTSYS